MPLDAIIGQVFTCIAPVDTMIIDFSVKNQVLAL
jgi:hypothetical protein